MCAATERLASSFKDDRDCMTDENPRPGRAGHGWLRATVQRGREADRQEGGAKR
jgi:hypothetical protein